MSYLSDTALRLALAEERLKVEPYPEDHCIQPCSIDLHLGPKLLVYKKEPGYALWPDAPTRRAVGGYPTVDLRDAVDISDRYAEAMAYGFCLQPGGFVLGATKEAISVDATLCAHVDGRSTLGRLGLMIHVTAGFADPGFTGHITLEIVNLAPYTIILDSDIGIGQLLVSEVQGEVKRPYGSKDVGSKYGGFQSGPVPPNLRRKL